MRSLYEIDNDILACVDEETGEVDIDKFDALNMERTAKLESIALWIKDLKAETDAISGEIKALQSRKDSKARRIESLTEYLNKALNGEKFETVKCLVSFRHTQKVEITDFDKIPDDYLKYSQPTADKTAIKAAIKDGLTIEGAELVDTMSMSIK